MLAQLICVDRRYQRMNCFNIRELQGILKRKFFTDLVNDTNINESLSDSILSMRFKVNSSSNLDSDTLSFFNLGTVGSQKSRSTSLSNVSTFSEPLSYLGVGRPFNLQPSIILDYLGYVSLRDLISTLKHKVNLHYEKSHAVQSWKAAGKLCRTTTTLRPF